MRDPILAIALLVVPVLPYILAAKSPRIGVSDGYGTASASARPLSVLFQVRQDEVQVPLRPNSNLFAFGSPCHARTLGFPLDPEIEIQLNPRVENPSANDLSRSLN